MAIETRSREEHSVRKITSGDYHLTDFRNKEAEVDDYGEWPASMLRTNLSTKVSTGFCTI